MRLQIPINLRLLRGGANGPRNVGSAIADRLESHHGIFTPLLLHQMRLLSPPVQGIAALPLLVVKCGD